MLTPYFSAVEKEKWMERIQVGREVRPSRDVYCHAWLLKYLGLTGSKG
jgi:hypothetical protein